MVNYHKTIFLKTCSKASQFPGDVGAEVAFIGRSNVGKSSTLNALTQQKHLAKTSKTPGRTQYINFFSVDEQHRLVDLPGYGYAEVPKTIKDNWHKLLDQYLRERESLKGLVLLMDIRHPLREFEKNILKWAKMSEIPVYILLTKSDKLSKTASLTVLRRVEKSLKEVKQKVTISLFSAKTKMGLEELRKKIDDWLIEEGY